MKRFNSFTIFYFLVIVTLHGQGIKFESNLSWKEIQSKAKSENKYIFLDCFATWCGPCKFMSNNIFNQKEVGDYFNTHFVSVAIQMDQTKNDPEAVKIWYRDAKLLEEKYSISAFPTYLFFSPEGKVVHRIIGIEESVKEFITNAAFAFEPNKQYYTIIGDYKEHLGDSAFLRNALIISINAKDNIDAIAIGDAYLDCLKDPYSKENLAITSKIHIGSSYSKWFSIYIKNVFKADDSMLEMGEVRNYMTQTLSIIIANEIIDSLFEETNNNQINLKEIISKLKKKYPMLDDELVTRLQERFKLDLMSKEIDPVYKDGAPLADWSLILRNMQRKYPGYDIDQIVAEQKIKYYALKKLWTDYERAALTYMKTYGRQLSDEEINNIAWYKVFLISDSQLVLSEALNWSKLTIDNYPQVNPAYVDTYANLLYKLGKKEDAIIWEKKALVIATKPIDKRSFEAALMKMQQGEKTWIQN